MITLYSGTPGSGKSLHQAIDIYYDLKYKRPVIANFNINTSYFKKTAPFYYIPNQELKPEKLVQISEEYFKNHRFKEGALKLYIDECQIMFNSREWNKPDRADWLVFFTQHRKYGFDIYLIAQFDRMIDRQIRSLIEYEVIHRKLGNFGIFGAVLNFIFFGNVFVSVRNWYPLKERVGFEFYRGKKKYFRIYNTFNTFNKKLEETENRTVDFEKIGCTPSGSAEGDKYISYQQKNVDNSVKV